MNAIETNSPVLFKVVINQKGQYSIWPVDSTNPLGWEDAGFQGQKEECLAYIESVWKDLTP